MTLKNLYTKPLSEIVNQMEMIDLKIHSDNKGNISTIEIKYAIPNTNACDELIRR